MTSLDACDYMGPMKPQEHQNHKHQNPSSMQNAYLVARTYEVSIIQTQNNLKQCRDHKHF